MPSPRVDQLVENNVKFAESWTNPFSMKQLRELMNDPILVLTCMDPRVVPEQFVGPNSLVAVFRNAGGRASPDVVRTINTVQSLAFKVQKAAVMVVHHTDCGMTHLSDELIKEDMRKRGIEVPDDFEPACYTAEQMKTSVQEDVQTLKASQLLKDIEIRGFVLTTETGLLEEV